MAEGPYNPLAKENLGKSVAEALLNQDAKPLGSLRSFAGAGIYAIYYSGPFPPYARLSAANAQASRVPIYIGKAIPSGGRKGMAVLSEKAQGTTLFKRLQEHAESIRAATNLEIDDFTARWLVVDDIWIPLGETLLIEAFKPVWNLELDGFGNHDPGSGRSGSLCPLWDTLHPGRPWAARQPKRTETAEDLVRKIASFLEKRPWPDDEKPIEVGKPL